MWSAGHATEVGAATAATAGASNWSGWRQLSDALGRVGCGWAGARCSRGRRRRQRRRRWRWRRPPPRGHRRAPDHVRRDRSGDRRKQRRGPGRLHGHQHRHRRHQQRCTYSLKAGGDAAAFSINAEHRRRDADRRTPISRRSPATTSPWWPPTRPTTAPSRRSAWRSTTWTRWHRRSPPAPPPPAINENSGAGQVVYTVTAPTPTTSAPVAPTASRPAATRRRSRINANTGAVTLTGEPELRDEAELQLHGRGHRRGQQQQRTGGRSGDQQPGRGGADDHLRRHRHRDQ